MKVKKKAKGKTLNGVTGIKITQSIKDKNPSLFGSRNIDDIVQIAIPNKFWGAENVVGGYKHRTDLHTADGWKEVVTPAYDSETQRKGVLIEDGEVFTYTIIDLTTEEIQARIQGELEGTHQQMIQDFMKQKIVDEANLMDDNEALQTIDLFPFWGVGMSLLQGEKVRAFDGLEVKLYKVIEGQGHVTQSDWHPTVTPNLFLHVAPQGEYLVWVQPAGGHDAYNTGDRVWFPEMNSTLYESLINANVWSPTAYPQGWEIVVL